MKTDRVKFSRFILKKVHEEFFGTIRPATTMVEVKSLIIPELLVEIEATAILNSKAH